MLHLMVGSVARHTHDVAPQTWRRYLQLFLDDVQAGRDTTATPGQRSVARARLPIGDTGGVTMTRIREYRTGKGLSVRELAVRAGVSPGLISQVERDVTDPSLETMRKIALVLDVPLFSLFRESDHDQVAIIRRSGRLRVATPHSTMSYTRASPGGARLEVLEGELEPGASSSDEPWSHPSQECVVVQAGVLIVHVGQHRHALYEGDSCTFDSTIPHRFSNESDQIARFLISVTPPSY